MVDSVKFLARFCDLFRCSEADAPRIVSNLAVRYREEVLEEQGRQMASRAGLDEVGAAMAALHARMAARRAVQEAMAFPCPGQAWVEL